jgi:hypothetical protein
VRGAATLRLIITILCSQQRAFTRYYLEHPHLIALDVRGKIFLNLFGISVNTVLDGSGQLIDNVTHFHSPCIVHANGPDKSFIEKFGSKIRNRLVGRPVHTHGCR